MKKTLYFIGSIVSGMFSSVLLWVVFRLYAPRFVSMFFWGPALERSYALGGPLATVLAFVAVLPLFFVCVNKACKIAATVPLSFFGFCAVIEPWCGTMPGSNNNFVALFMSALGAALFSAAIYFLWAEGRRMDLDDNKGGDYEDTLGR